MFDALDDPYSHVPDLGGVQGSLQGISGQFEGIGATIGDARPRTGTTAACTTLGPDCRLAIVAPLDGLAGREGRAAAWRRRSTPIDGASLAGCTRRPGARHGPRPQGHDGRRCAIRARRRRAARRPDRARRHRPARGRSPTRSPAASRLRQADRLLGPRLGRVQRRPSRPTSRRAGRKLILDLRGNPGGFVTAARDDRQPVPRRRPDLLAAGRRRAT